MSYLFPDSDEAVRIGQGSVPRLLAGIALRWLIVSGALMGAVYLLVRVVKLAWNA